MGKSGVTETVGLRECGAIQARGMSTPVRQLMQGRAVKSCGVLEGLLGWQMDAILGANIESPVGLVVEHLRPRVLQDLLAGLHGLEDGMLFRQIRRNTIQLSRVEDGVDAMD